MSQPVPEERDDAHDLKPGDVPPGEHSSDLPDGDSGGDAADAQQGENAETTLDQPSQ